MTDEPVTLEELARWSPTGSPSTRSPSRDRRVAREVTSVQCQGEGQVLVKLPSQAAANRFKEWLRNKMR